MGLFSQRFQRRIVITRHPERCDNLVCAVLVLEDAVVVKTVMHHFALM